MFSPTPEVIVEWLREASRDASASRRTHRRYPFFRLVTIRRPGVSGSLSAFSRDVSPTGIGLVHPAPIDSGRVALNISTVADDRIEVAARIEWCEPWGGDWHFSGGRFMSLTTAEAMTLLLRTMLAQVDQRTKQRYPFFRPLTITYGGSQKTTITALSRDISGTGVGLLHNQPLEIQTVSLMIPRRANPPYEMMAEVIWCKPCGEGWHISGARFQQILLEEIEERLL